MSGIVTDQSFFYLQQGSDSVAESSSVPALTTMSSPGATVRHISPVYPVITLASGRLRGFFFHPDPAVFTDLMPGSIAWFIPDIKSPSSQRSKAPVLMM